MTVQLAAGAREAQVVDREVPAGRDAAEGVTFNAAASVPVLVITMYRGVPVRKGEPAVLLTLSAREDGLEESVVVRTVTPSDTDAEVIEPSAAEILVRPAAAPVASPLLPTALLMVAAAGVSDDHVTVLVMFCIDWSV